MAIESAMKKEDYDLVIKLTLEGELRFHLGDSSTFLARKAKERGALNNVQSK